MILMKRLLGQRIRINSDIVITFGDYHNGVLTLDIDAPSDISVMKDEDWREMQPDQSRWFNNALKTRGDHEKK